MLWECVPCVCGGGGGCAGGGVPLRAVLALSLCGEVSLGGILIIIIYKGHLQPPPGKNQMPRAEEDLRETESRHLHYVYTIYV